MYEENEKDLKSALSYYERCFKIFEMVCYKQLNFLKKSFLSKQLENKWLPSF